MASRKKTVFFILLGITGILFGFRNDVILSPTKSADVNFAGDSALRLIHVYVALCDNDSQGIVPVSKRMGNGNDPDNNLYWGNGYGVRTYFNNSEDWRLIATIKKPTTEILERCVWKHRRYNCIMVADAWRGARIKPCTVEFLKSASGNNYDTLTVNDNGSIKTLMLGQAQLVSYVGHDGLMDFTIENPPVRKDSSNKDVFILACASKLYFKDAIRTAGANPVLWTTNLLGPEAYVLKAGIDGWLLREPGEKICDRAAKAYDQYVHCGYNGARRIFTTGF
ncbi:MAG: hypothetical protein L6Q81_08450 [Bacteroidia bacterium]|nr:hypothetical protein [Bacteroidia bacterium]